MGAYRHSRLNEIVWGGATKTVIGTATVLGYDVALGGASYARRHRSTMRSPPPDRTIALDVDLSSEKSASPRSVALVGASSAPGLRRTRHSRRIFARRNSRAQFGLVNPRYAEIDGVAAVGSLRQVAVRARTRGDHGAGARRFLASSIRPGRRGSAGALIVSAGLGHGPGSLAEAAERAARKYGMRLIGPNCLGIMMPGASLNASFAAHMPAAGNLALISQSGAIAAGMVDWAAQRGVGFSGIVSIGDQLDVDIADLLDYFAMDGKTRAILLYIEAIKDARKFMSAARAAAQDQAGRGRQVRPHGAGREGGRDPYRRAGRRRTRSMMRRSAAPGILRVSDLRELFDCAETLGRVESPPGKRLAILTNGGGIGVLAVDRLGRTRRNSRRDRRLTPARSSTRCCRRPGPDANPVDIVGDADAARYAAALEVLLADRRAMTRSW